MMGKAKDRTIVGFFAIIVILFLVFAFSGGLIPTQQQQVFQITQPQISPATQTACEESVNPNILGKSATVTVNAYDQESNTPYSAAVDTTLYTVSDGMIATSTDTSAYSMSSYSVGDVISFYGGDSSYYLDKKENVCINKESFPVELDAHAAGASTDITSSAFDDTGATALSGGTNTTQEDRLIL